jgi:lipopolysaccharide export system protein LptC
MARADNTYSRIVAGMKILLPLAALGLLSTLFLISRTIDPSKSVSLAEIDVERRAQELGVTNPSFAGVTAQGDAVSITADMARPDADNPGQFSADRVRGEIRLSGGTVIDLHAAGARLDQGAMTATLLGGVRISSSTGYEIETERLDTQLNALSAESAGPVRATGPIGSIEAGRMHLHHNSDTDTAEMLFTGGVMLIYVPSKPGDMDQ